VSSEVPVPDELIDWPGFIARHGPAALLFARQIAGTHADAEDALHEGFLRFWPRHPSARDPAALFFACVRTAALDQKRGGARRQAREAAHSPPQLVGPVCDETREHVERALQQLPAEQREVVVLKIWSDLTFARIADVLAESPHTVASRYRYAMQKLEHLLAPEFNHEQC
jgi:RNA polymerase sigma-70 factor (ECF subfamily)